MTFFTQEKGTLLPEKGHLANLGAGGGLGNPAPPVPTPLKLFNIELFIAEWSLYHNASLLINIRN